MYILYSRVFSIHLKVNFVKVRVTAVLLFGVLLGLGSGNTSSTVLPVVMMCFRFFSKWFLGDFLFL